MRGTGGEGLLSLLDRGGPDNHLDDLDIRQGGQHQSAEQGHQD